MNSFSKTLGIIGLFAAVFLPRVIGLGQILTVDEPLWLSRGQTFINALSVGSFEKTVIGGQPGVTTTWLVGLSAPWQSLFAGQLAIALTTSILLLLITYFLRILLGKKWGTITGIFLALDPFLIAHSRIVHTDALVALFYLASLSCLLCAFAFKKFQKRYIVMSAILAAGALLTKIFGLILIPTALFILCIRLIQKKESIISIVRMVGLWLGTFALATFIAWPALWFDSEKVFNIVSSSATRHGEGTRIEETTSSQWYYLRELAFRSSLPVAILLPITLWQWKKRTFPRHARITLTLVAAGILFVLLLNSGSDRSDRYILFTHLCFVIAAPLGLRWIVMAIGKIQNAHRWAAVVLALPVLYLTADAIRIHPYYLAHYNRLYTVEEDHKLGWGEGLEQAASWIEQQNPNAKVVSYYPRVFSHFYSGETESITHIDDADAAYAVVYRSMFERGESAESDIIQKLLYEKTEKLEHTVIINGLPYVWIFSL